jgi:hypothetical protein
MARAALRYADDADDADDADARRWCWWWRWWRWTNDGVSDDLATATTCYW